MKDVLSRFQDNLTIEITKGKFLFKGISWADQFEHYFREGGITPGNGSSNGVDPWITEDPFYALDRSPQTNTLIIFRKENILTIDAFTRVEHQYNRRIHHYKGADKIEWGNNIFHILLPQDELDKIEIIYNHISNPTITWEDFLKLVIVTGVEREDSIHELALTLRRNHF